ncbi:type II toxin-antitoxin system HicA family toxin [Phytohalomonas tamaricis]|uniref:type II toxin-antitoxin system HicA family toxin n=1 Tax=Phytohalomonas tamaricis TaxID=2081032 RepID=UPI0021D41825|nr:type II toxin-antitoxin system HicA family toxin [Phytohalomonas tamaricis]
MGDKRLDRLKQRPSDFTWDELAALLRSLGYRLKTASGSRRKFIDEEKRKILLHEPHPGNILKAYQIENVLIALEEHGKL